MSRNVMQFTPTRLRAELQRLGAALSEHNHALELLRSAPDYPSKAAEIAWREGRIQTLEDTFEDTTTALEALEEADAASLPDLRRLVIETAKLWGQISTSVVASLAHPPGEPGADATKRRVHKVFDELVSEGQAGREGLAGSGDTALPATGQGRPPELYVYVPAEPEPRAKRTTRRTRKSP